MQVERYRIILTGWVVSGHQARNVITELSRLFKIPEDKVRPLLAGEPSIIRRDLTLGKAERLRNKIERRGAVCNLKLVIREEHEDRTCRFERTGILEPDLNMDSTQFVPLAAGPTPSVKNSIIREETKITASPVSRRRKKVSLKQRKGRGVAPKLLFAVVMAIAMVWGYLYLYPDRQLFNQTPDVFTLAPAKNVGSDGKTVR